MPAQMGSPYVPLDHWMYPAIMRLYSLGYVDTVFLGMRPWTRLSIDHMLEETGEKIEDAGSTPAADEAEGIYNALVHELHDDTEGPCLSGQGQVRIESSYTNGRYISGTPLRDSFHLGQTIVNDYGRPYASGFNNYTGLSGYVTAGRFVLYARGEMQAGPSFAGYGPQLSGILSGIDQLLPADGCTEPTIPCGPFSAYANGRLLEAYLSAHVLGHEISFGKQDNWFGPAMGGGMAYSNNAENIYSFRINRIEPLHVPGLSRLLGPFRYDFMVGSLKGHSAAYTIANDQNSQRSFNDPWVHVEKISFKPTENVEIGFERTVIWGGKGHVPITIDSFLRSFFSFTSPSAAIKGSNKDPGARFGAFDATWRLPYLHHWMTFYVDSEVHDDVSPADAPRRASIRPGLYLSHIPGLQKLDLRVEGINTDPSVSTSQGGHFMYYEYNVREGYTNKGNIFGDWMGREGKGGQAWMTWHLSGNEWIQASWRRQKNAKDFIYGGTTLDDVSLQVVKRLTSSLELNAMFRHENWLAPIYMPGKQTVTVTQFQLTWYPERKVSF